MSSFGGSPGFYSGIELAVQVTGANAVADFDAHVNKLKADLNLLQAQLQATGATIQLAADMAKLVDQLRQAEEAAAAARRVLGGLPASLDATGRSARGAGQAVLELSRGFEDFTTGGALGALNNVPRMFGGIAQAAGLAAPQVMAVESAASFLATTGYIVWKNWDQVKKLFDDGLGPKMIDDIKSVTAALKELTEKTWKTRVDVQDINNAKLKLDELTRAKQGYDKLNAPDEETKATGDAVTRAIVESGAQGGREGFTTAVIAAANAGDSPEVVEYRKKIANLDALIEDAKQIGNPTLIGQLDRQRQALADSKEGRQAVEMQNRRQSIADQIGAAANGDEIQRKWLQDLYEKNPGKFDAVGVNGDFGRQIAAAGTEGRKRAAEVDAEQERIFERSSASGKEAHDFLQGIRKAEKKDAADLQKRTNEDAARVGPGVDDQIQKALFDAIKGGATPEAAMHGQRGGLIHTLRGRDVGEDVVSDVAQRILEKAAASAQNLINEGGTPKLDVKADREAKKGDNERNKAINAEVHRVGPGVDDALERALLRRVAGGQGIDQAAAALDAQLRNRLGSRSVAPDLQGDVSSEILRRIANKVANKVVMADNPRVAAAGEVVHDQAKNATAYGREFQARTGANDQQAAYAGQMVAGLVSQGANAETAMQGTYAAMSGNLELVSGTMRQMIAGQERMLAMIANASQGMGQIQARQAMLESQMRMSAMDQRRMRTLLPPQGLTFGGGR